MVVEQGLCTRLNSMTLKAVRTVHPPACRMSLVAEAESRLEHHAGPLTRPGDAGGEDGKHQDRGDDDLVGRDGHHVGEQDHAVEPDPEAGGIEKVNEVLGERAVADRHVADQPDDGARGDCEDDGPPEDEDRSVDERGVERLQDPRRAVGRQLQVEGGRLAAQHGA